MTFTVQAAGGESVHAELVRLQKDFGLTFAWTDDQRFRSVSFDTRTIVDSQEAPAGFIQTALNSFDQPHVSRIGGCWSHDRTELAATITDLSTEKSTFGIAALPSKQIRPVGINVDQQAYATSQCWSPDGQRLVYAFDGAVRLYQMKADRSDAIAAGTDPTWSPDGQWIAFRNGDIYYVMHPDGSGRKELFRVRWGKAISALYWSPDSRIVAYVRQLGFLQGGAIDSEFNELRVRRLADGSDDRLCGENVPWYADYQWVTSSSSTAHTETVDHGAK